MDIQRELKNDIRTIKGAIDSQDGIFIPLKEVERLLIQRIKQIDNLTDTDVEYKNAKYTVENYENDLSNIILPEILDLVNDFNNFLKDTIYEFNIVGSDETPFEDLKIGDAKFFQIVERDDNFSVYDDWSENEFTLNTLKEYADELSKKYADGDSEIDKEYLELGKLIVKYFKDENNKKI